VTGGADGERGMDHRGCIETGGVVMSGIRKIDRSSDSGVKKVGGRRGKRVKIRRPFWEVRGGRR